MYTATSVVPRSKDQSPGMANGMTNASAKHTMMKKNDSSPKAMTNQDSGLNHAFALEKMLSQQDPYQNSHTDIKSPSNGGLPQINQGGTQQAVHG